jgi:CO dehydrogenase/acetyl-CoA synthase epsilon subunit
MKNLSNFRQQILIDLIEDKIYMEENINEVENLKEDDYLKELKEMLKELTN